MNSVPGVSGFVAADKTPNSSALVSNPRRSMVDREKPDFSAKDKSPAFSAFVNSLSCSTLVSSFTGGATVLCIPKKFKWNYKKKKKKRIKFSFTFLEVIVLAAEGESFLFAMECTDREAQIDLAAILVILSLFLLPDSFSGFVEAFSSVEKAERL